MDKRQELIKAKVDFLYNKESLDITDICNNGVVFNGVVVVDDELDYCLDTVKSGISDDDRLIKYAGNVARLSNLKDNNIYASGSVDHGYSALTDNEVEQVIKYLDEYAIDNLSSTDYDEYKTIK